MRRATANSRYAPAILVSCTGLFGWVAAGRTKLAHNSDHCCCVSMRLRNTARGLLLVAVVLLLLLRLLLLLLLLPLFLLLRHDSGDSD